MADTPKIVPPKQGQAPNGKPALVDSTGRIYMRDQAGNLKRVAPDSFGRAIVDEGWEVAIPDDFTREANEDAPWTTAAESFAAGIPEAGLAVPRAAGQLAGVAGAELAGGLGLAEEAGVEAAKQKVVADPLLPTGREVVAGGLHPFDEGERSAYLERARGRAEESPWAAGLGGAAGEIVGSGPALIGPVGVGARLGLGAIAGAASGISGATEEAYIKNIPLSAEHLVAGAGIGAGLGLAGEGLFMGFGKGAGWVGKKVGLAPEDSALAHMGHRRSDLEKLASTQEGRDINAARTVTTANRVHVKAEWFKDVADDSGNVVQRAAKQGEEGAYKKFRLADPSEKGAERLMSHDLGDMAARVDGALSASQERLGSFYRAATKDVLEKPALQKMFREDVVEPFLAKARTEAIAPHLNSIALDAAEKRVAIDNLFQNIETKLRADPTPETFAQVRQELGRMVYDRESPAAALIRKELATAERTAEDYLAAGMDKIMIGPAAPGTVSKAKSEYLAMRHQIRDLHTMQGVVGGAAAAARVKPIGLGSQFVGMTAGIQGAEAGTAAWLYAAIAKHTVGGIRYLHGSAFYRASKGMEQQFQKGIKGAIKQGISRTARGARRIAAGKFYAPGENLESAYKRRSAEISKVAANPVAMAEKIGNSLGEASSTTPKLAGMVAMVSMRGVSFLASKLPPNSLSVNPLNPHEPKVTASPSEMRKFMRYWETVNDPRVAIKALSQGELTIEHIETLKAVYPLMFGEMQKQALELIATSKQKLSFQQRSQLDLLLELNGAGEPSLSPGFQNAMAQVEQQQAAQKQASAPKPSAKAGKAQSDRYQSLSNKIESGA